MVAVVVDGCGVVVVILVVAVAAPTPMPAGSSSSSLLPLPCFPRARFILSLIFSLRLAILNFVIDQ